MKSPWNHHEITMKSPRNHHWLPQKVRILPHESYRWATRGRPVRPKTRREGNKVLAALVSRIAHPAGYKVNLWYIPQKMIIDMYNNQWYIQLLCRWNQCVHVISISIYIYIYIDIMCMYIEIYAWLYMYIQKSIFCWLCFPLTAKNSRIKPPIQGWGWICVCVYTKWRPWDL